MDAGLFVTIAFGIRNKSRFAAVAGLCLYIVERIAMIQRGGMGGIILLFVNAVRGTFAYHQMTAAGQARPYVPNP